MAICKGCGLDKKLIKAHAIPESFFVKMKKEYGKPKIMTDAEGEYPKKSPIGVYDDQILCYSCENIFGNFDDYGFNILLRQEQLHEELIKDGKVVGYKIINVDYKKLKLFFISVLWRASISSQKFYSRVKLGSSEKKAKELIWNNDAGKQSEFSVVLTKFTDTTVGRIMLDPDIEQWDGVNYCRIYMYGYVVYIKIDDRDSSNRLKKFELSPNKKLIVPARNIGRSSELSIISAIIKKAL